MREPEATPRIQLGQALTFRWLSCLLVLAVLAAYLPLAQNDFIHFDDGDYVFANQVVVQGLTWEGIAYVWQHPMIDNYHPLTMMSHMLDVSLFGLNARYHHMVSLLWHLLVVWLWFYVLSKWTGQRDLAFVVALLFGVHPINVETVAWVSERKSLLSTFFLLITLLGYQRWMKKRHWKDFVLLHLSFAAGLLCKAMIVTLPFCLLLIDIWPLRGRSDWSFKRLAKLVTEKSILILMALGMSLLTLLIQTESASSGRAMLERLFHMLASFAIYIGKLIWPHPLVVMYPYESQGFLIALIGFLIFALGTTALLMRRKHILLIAWFWFLGVLIPVSGIVPIGYHLVADRYLYLAMIGFWAVLVWITCSPSGGKAPVLWHGGHQRRHITKTVSQRLKSHIEKRPISVRGTKVLRLGLFNGWMIRLWLLVSLLFAGKTFTQTQLWKDSNTIFPYTLQHSGPNPVIAINYVQTLLNQGHYQEAAPWLKKLAGWLPDSARVKSLQGWCDVNLGSTERGIDYLKESLLINPNVEYGLNYLADAYRLAGLHSLAAEQDGEILKRNPQDTNTRIKRAIALSESGDKELAESEFILAIQLEPGSSFACLNYAIWLNQQNRWHESLTYFELADKLNASRMSQLGLATAHLELEQYQSAQIILQDLLRDDPKDMQVLKLLQRIRSEQPD